LQTACNEDEETAQALLMASEVTMQNNSLTTCIDRNGQYYRIPICCINDPVNYQQDFQMKKLLEK
jgi:hypothetical protein